MKAYPLEDHQMRKKALDTRYAFDGVTVSFIKNVLDQTDLDGYGKPLYHLISWALLKRRYTHQHEIRRSKKKEEITSTLSPPPPSHRRYHRGVRSHLSIFFHLCL